MDLQAEWLLAVKNDSLGYLCPYDHYGHVSFIKILLHFVAGSCWIYDMQLSPSGGARGIGLILVSSVSDVDSAERPFQDRCRAPRAEDMPLDWNAVCWEL